MRPSLDVCACAVENSSSSQCWTPYRHQVTAGLGRVVRKFRGKETVFTQGDPAKNVMYIQEGGVKLTVVNETGKEAVVAILGPYNNSQVHIDKSLLSVVLHD